MNAIAWNLWNKKNCSGRTLGKVMVDGADVCLEQIKRVWCGTTSGMCRSSQQRIGPRVNGSGYGAMHNPLRLGTGDGKNYIPTPVWRFEKEGGRSCIAGWAAGFQKTTDRLSKTERKG